MRRDGVYFAGHRVHLTVVFLPLGGLALAAIFDILHLLFDSSTFALVAHWLIIVGIISALFAAVFGFIDWLRIEKGTRAKKVGAVHGIGNVIVLGLFGASSLLRWDAPANPGVLASVLSIAGLLLAAVTGWLGGELVNRLGIGVYDDANPNAPSSLAKASKAHRNAPTAHVATAR